MGLFISCDLTCKKAHVRYKTVTCNRSWMTENIDIDNYIDKNSVKYFLSDTFLFHAKTTLIIETQKQIIRASAKSFKNDTREVSKYSFYHRFLQIFNLNTNLFM